MIEERDDDVRDDRREMMIRMIDER